MKKHLKLISVLLVLVLFFLFAVGSSNSSEEPKETTTLENETYADEDFEPELEYKDDYLIATYDYLSTPLPSTESIDVYLKATIFVCRQKLYSPLFSYLNKFCHLLQ